MHKSFYAGGFLFNPNTEQILLQQYPSTDQHIAPWGLFGESCAEQADPEEVFKKVILKSLNVKIDKVIPIYSSVNDAEYSARHIVYAEIEDIDSIVTTKDKPYAWFTFKSILKLSVSPQMKHDIVVGQRVIAAAVRRSYGEHSF